jgi:alpha-2-macroglobulin-like protein
LYPCWSVSQPVARRNSGSTIEERPHAASGWVAAEDSLLGYQWNIPAELPGGQYTIDVSYPHSGQPPAERKFEIRAYRAPRLKSQIKFLRDGYGPGDEVVATLEVERAEGGVPAGAEVTAIARVDGQEILSRENSGR